MQAENPNIRNKRKHVRVKRTLFVQCRRRGSDELWASVVIQDISIAGLSFFSDKEFKVGEIIEVKLTTFFKGAAVLIFGEIVGVELKPPSKRQLVRVCIIHVNEKDKTALEEYVQVFLEGEQKRQRKEAGE